MNHRGSLSWGLQCPEKGETKKAGYPLLTLYLTSTEAITYRGFVGSVCVCVKGLTGKVQLVQMILENSGKQKSSPMLFENPWASCSSSLGCLTITHFLDLLHN